MNFRHHLTYVIYIIAFCGGLTQASSPGSECYIDETGELDMVYFVYEHLFIKTKNYFPLFQHIPNSTGWRCFKGNGS